MCSTWFATVLGVTPSRCGDLLVGVAACEQAEHLDLARGEAGRPVPAGRGPLAGRAQHRVDRVAVEGRPRAWARSCWAAGSGSNAGRCGRGSVSAW